jgi:hypothetical protein
MAGGVEGGLDSGQAGFRVVQPPLFLFGVYLPRQSRWGSGVRVRVEMHGSETD